MSKSAMQFGKIVAAASALVYAGATGAAGQGAVPRALRVSKSVPAAWSGQYSDNIHGGVRCDANGNLYLQPMTSMRGELSVADPVEESRGDGSAGPEFSLRSVGGKQKYDLEPNSTGQLNTSIEDFFVDPQGRVYFSVRRCMPPNPDCSIEIAQFDSNGQERSVTRLAYGGLAHFMPQHLAVFPDGRFFVAGLTEGPGRPFGWYAAIYDADGKLHAVVSDLPDDIKPKLPPEGTMSDMVYAHEVGLSMVAGDEGKVYLLRPLKQPILYVIGEEEGAVLQHSSIAPPFPDAVPVSMSDAGKGTVVIQFGKQIREGEVRMTGNFLSVVDAATGRTLSSYTADGKTGGMFGCFVPDSGFEFLSPWETAGSWVIHFDPTQ